MVLLENQASKMSVLKHLEQPYRLKCSPPIFSLIEIKGFRVAVAAGQMFRAVTTGSSSCMYRSLGEGPRSDAEDEVKDFVRAAGYQAQGETRRTLKMAKPSSWDCESRKPLENTVSHRDRDILLHYSFSSAPLSFLLLLDSSSKMNCFAFAGWTAPLNPALAICRIICPTK
jgi:hypothetical protein